jgi:hypothetical protein
MIRARFRLLCCLVFGSITLYSQVIRSEYLDLPLPGQWESEKDLGNGFSGVEAYYDTKSGSLVQIRALPSMQKVSEISKFFQQPGHDPNTDASEVLAAVAFQLPEVYTQRAAKDIAKGNKPPRLWEMKEGEGNPAWFYTAQLFGQYNIKAIHGGSEVSEEYQPVRVLRAEHRSVGGGDALVLELETDRPPTEQALKRFHMPPGMKDQHVRYTWIQFAPGGVAARQGVLSIVAASASNSELTGKDLLTQISSAKLKPME